MSRVTCPSCEEETGISDRPKVGHRVKCHNCAEELIVIRLDPIEVGWLDSGDWEVGDLAWEGKAMKTRRKRAFNPRDSFWEESVDWEPDEAGRRIKSKRNHKKKMRGPRDGRRRRSSRGDFSEDF